MSDTRHLHQLGDQHADQIDQPLSDEQRAMQEFYRDRVEDPNTTRRLNGIFGGPRTVEQAKAALSTQHDSTNRSALFSTKKPVAVQPQVSTSAPTPQVNANANTQPQGRVTPTNRGNS